MQGLDRRQSVAIEAQELQAVEGDQPDLPEDGTLFVVI